MTTPRPFWDGSDQCSISANSEIPPDRPCGRSFSMLNSSTCSTKNSSRSLRARRARDADPHGEDYDPRDPSLTLQPHEHVMSCLDSLSTVAAGNESDGRGVFGRHRWTKAKR